MRYVVIMALCVAGSFVSVYLAGLGAGQPALHLTGFITGALVMTIPKAFE